MALDVRVMMTYTDENATAMRVATFHEGLKAARKWLDEWTDQPASEAIPGIVSINIERVQ